MRWVTHDVPFVHAVLGAALGIAWVAGPSMAIPGLRLDVAGPRAIPGTRVADHLEMVTADESAHRSPLDPAALAAPRLVALGWATVDLERAAEAWPALRWRGVPRDTLVGARGLLGDPEVAGEGKDRWRPGHRLLLLEPDTEGRIAATLARHGEGPAALYVGLSPGSIAGSRARLAPLGVRLVQGAGPFGPEIALAGPPASGPTVVLLRIPGRATPGGPADSGRGTIRP